MRDGECPSRNEQIHLSRASHPRSEYDHQLWVPLQPHKAKVWKEAFVVLHGHRLPGFKTDDFYKDISGDVKARFDMSSYSHSHPPLMRVNKEVNDLMKDEVGRRIMTEFVKLRIKLYIYKTLSGSGDKK